MNIKATIFFKVDNKHPDLKYIVHPENIQSFEDVYIIDKSRFWCDDLYSYIKNDLRLVAGGGYDSDHIYDVRFEFKTITENQLTAWKKEHCIFV